MIFELADDLEEALEAMPAEQKDRRLLSLLLEAIRRDLHFLDRHPTALFQCLWNTGWWHDSPDAKPHYLAPPGGWPADVAWNRPGTKLSAWLEIWRKEKNRRTPGFTWIRALRPPPQELGTRQRLVLAGHEKYVAAIAWSPDETEIVSVSYDHSVRLWNTRTGAQVALLEGQLTQWSCVAWSADGRTIAAGNENGGIACWDAATRTPLRIISAAESWIYRIVFSPDGASFYSASADSRIRRWNMQTYQEEYAIALEKVRCLACSPDGSRLATSGWEDRTVRVWNAGDGSEILPLRRMLEESPNDIEFSPDGASLVAGMYGGTRLWTTRPSAEIAIFQYRKPDHDPLDNHFVMAPGCQWMAVSSSLPLYERGMNPLHFEHRLRICDAETGAERANFVAHSEGILGIDVSSGGDRIASYSFDYSLKVWDATSLALVHDLRVPNSSYSTFTAAKFTADGESLAGTCYETVWLWNVESGAVTSAFAELDSKVEVLACLPDGRLLCGCEDGSIRVQETSAAAFGRRLDGHRGKVIALTVSRDGAWIASGSEDNTARIWNAADGMERAFLPGDTTLPPYEGKITSVAFSPDGSLLVAGSADKSVRVWETATQKLLATFQGHNNEIHSVAFHDDGTRFYSGSSSAIRVWNPAGDPNAGLVVLGDRASTLSFAPQGNAIAIAVADSSNSITIWNLITRQCAILLTGHQDSVSCIAYSPSGTQIASCSSDRTIRIWNVRGEVLVSQPKEVRGEKCFASKFELTEDGRHVLAGTWIWDASTALGTQLTCFRQTGPDGWGPIASYHPSSASPASARPGDPAAVLDDLTLRTFLPYHGEEIVIAARLDRKPSLIQKSSRGGSIAVIHDAMVTIWSAYAAPEPLGVLRGHEKRVQCIGWSPDGNRIATGSSDCTVRLWDGNTYTETQVLRGHEREVMELTFSPDGLRLATGDGGGVLRIWDMETRTQIAVLSQPKQGVESLAFSEDGLRILSTAYHDVMHEFDISTQSLVSKATGIVDLKSIAQKSPLLARRTGVEATFFHAASQKDVAWYPDPLKSLIATGIDRTWAGLSQYRLNLLRLEIEPKATLEVTDDSLRGKQPVKPTGTWWDKLLAALFGTSNSGRK